jgi:phosphate/phosphite/phosphonate ABC transporter binding protein
MFTGPLPSNQINTAPISMQQPGEPVKVFISYAHEDQELRKELEKHLIVLTHSKKIEIWHDQEIPPGADWEEHIDIHLKDADMILLLISSSFIASKYCWNKEVQEALERHKAGTARVIPIILRPVVWEDTPLGKLQALPTRGIPVTEWTNQDTAFQNVVQGIQKVLEKSNILHEIIYNIRSNIQTLLKQTVSEGASGTGFLYGRLLLISTALLMIYLLSVGLDLLNIPLPAWVGYMAPFLVIPFVLLLIVEARKAHTDMKLKQRRAFLSLSAATLGLLALGSFIQRMGQLTQLRMGLITTGDTTLADMRPLENDLSSYLHIPVSSVYGQTYKDVIDALAAKNIEIAWLGPFSYLRAHQNYGARIILHRLTVDMQKTYQSYIIANPKANIRVLEDLKGQHFALADANSTSGRIIPLYELKQSGFDINKDIKPYYVGSHANVLAKVLSGEFPAGAVKSTTYNRSLERGEFQKDNLIVIMKSRPIPTGPIVVRGDIQHDEELRIQDALLIVAETDPALVHTLNDGGFVKAIHKSYEFLLPIATELGIDIASLD